MKQINRRDCWIGSKRNNAMEYMHVKVEHGKVILYNCGLSNQK